MSNVGLISNFIGAWLSLVERCVRDAEVVGSNPVAPIFLYSFFRWKGGNGMKLLFAEDEVDMSEALVDILTYHKYTLDAVFDGEEALDYVTIGNPYWQCCLYPA